MKNVLSFVSNCDFSLESIFNLLYNNYKLFKNSYSKNF
ncbi:hypothetical protein LEP1GSC087_4727 [Leptospira interrogans serovar Bataviae str. L1111]|nr:hypothetical protein LEP1GSC087_4727 [Leptospira interrogans serovar Bataviae str. L1111]